MFELHSHTGRRVMAMLLVFAMMFAMVGEYAPSWFRAYAEEVTEDSSFPDSEDSASDEHESSHSDGGSSHSHESSSHSDSGSLDSHESSSSDSDSPDGYESSSSEDDSSDSYESNSPDSDSSDRHESEVFSEEQADVQKISGISDASEGVGSEPVEAASEEIDFEMNDSGDASEEPEAVQRIPSISDTVKDAGVEPAEAASEGEKASGDIIVSERVEEAEPVVSEAIIYDDNGSAEADAPSETEDHDRGAALTVSAASDEGEVAGSEPVFTTQAYVAPAVLTKDGGEETRCVLQQKIDDAMQSAGDTLSGRIRVVLEKDIAYDGDVKIEKGDREVADDFELEIASEDAGDDGSQSEGTTTFTGSMSIQGIHVAIRGVGLPGRVTVESAKLDYTGSRSDDTVNVALNSDASADIQTGEGGDTVSAAINQNATATIDTGAGDDRVNLADASVGVAVVDTGDDNDAVEVDVSPVSGYSAGEIDVKTGDGDDSVTLINVDGGSVVEDSRKGNITVDLGTGVNEAAVSADVAGVAPNVTINGEDGSDHVHITGTLDGKRDAGERISGTRDSLDIASDKGAMKLALQSTESLTDDLRNKRTETLTADGGKAVSFTYDGAEDFTNYVLKAPAGKIEKIVISGKDGQPLMLSSLVIDTDAAWDGENRLVIPAGATIEARGMTVRLTAKDIQVDGTIKADTVQLEALDGTGMYSRNFGDLYSAFNGTIPVPGVDQAGSALVAGAEMAWDMVNINDGATITIGKKGAVLASGDVILLARVEQSGSLISVIPVNLVNVKVAHASVDIAGKVYAGVSNIDSVNSDLSNVEFDAGKSIVRANAQIKTTIGYDEKGRMTDGMPVAVSVVTANASVDVRENAEINAGGVQLGAQSEIRAATRADSGTAGLPAAVAVAVLINDVRTTVDGRVTARNGDVSVTANGDVNARTIADKGVGQESVSGGYAAVTVALQDVKAELDKNAIVDAKGKAQVLSNAVEKVENHATSGKQASEEEVDRSLRGQLKTDILALVTDVILPNVMDSLGEQYFPDSAEEKLEKAIKRVSTGDHSVKLADGAQAHGDVQTSVDTMDGKTRVNVYVTPREGYRVKSVKWRGYNAGDDQYSTGDAIGSGSDWSFIQNMQNVMVFVTYEEAEASDEPATDGDDAELEEFFRQYQQQDEDDTPVSDGEVSQILEDLNAELQEDRALDEELRALEDETEFVNFTLSGINGSVLTVETEDDDNIHSLKKVYTGQRVELIPNAADGYKLKNGGLTATYSVTEKVNGKDTVVVKKIVINPDDQGRYYLEVPEKDKLDISQGIAVNADFEAGESDVNADQTQLQMTGTFAVAVTENDNQAVIAEGARIKAGSVEVTADASTDVQNIADGSSVSRAGEVKAADEYKIRRPGSKEYTGYDVEGMKFGLLADATRNGSIKVERSGAGRYEFTIEATPEEGYAAGTALLTYYRGGEKRTVKLKPDGAGKYHVNLAGSGLNMDEGSTAVLSFGFVGVGGEDVTVSEVSTHEPQSVISNPILVSYNALKDEKYDRIAGYMGRVLYNEHKNRVEGGNITAYAFVADTEKGYKLDGGLMATWKDASGQERSKALQKEGGAWYLEMAGIPAGAPVRVSAAFKEDFHDFKADGDKTENGKITLHDEQVKSGDNPKITVTPDAGFSVGDIEVTYNDRTLKLSNGDLKQVEKDGKVVEGLYELKEGLGTLSDGNVTVSASFNRKSIGIYAGEDDKAEDYTLSEKNAAKGDKVTVTPSDDKLRAGYKVTRVTVTDAGGNTVAESSDGVFTVPENTESSAKLTVKAELGLKDIEIKSADLSHGTVTSAVARADRGEKVTLTIAPDAHFRLKSGTLKAVVTDDKGNTTEVFAARQSDTTYTFDMPADIAKGSKVSFIGDFEPGQSDSSAVETSLGAGIAVTISNSETRADVSGKITSRGDVAARAGITGGVKTETRAGYSKGNIGMGGAVSVQVASMDAKGLIHDSADLSLDGRLIVDSGADINYNVSADASGNKEAASAGVGAGIAVAVNGSDVFAGVQDGASIAQPMKGFAVTAIQKLKDEVRAKAGANGGAAVVPVAAVDVTAAKASAYMGKAFDGKLSLAENAAVSAGSDASHTISADASAAGKSAGVGGAFGVSVISDSATAKLNQSVDASQVTVAAETLSKVANTATASASGGKTSGKSADQQADGLIGSASRLAGKNGSSGVSGNSVDRMTSDRQQAETAEGSVAVAGAVVVNVQDSVTRAEILDGVDVKAAGLLAVTALNGTTSKVKANASTTHSNIGVGVGVAVNIVGLENIARMGNGEFEAAMLKVAANTKETLPEERKPEPSKARTVDGAASELAEMVSDYMTDLSREIGLDQYVPADLLGSILSPIVEEVTDSLLKASGLDQLFGGGGIQEKYDNAVKLLQDKSGALVNLPDKLIEPMMETVKDALELGSLSDEQYGDLSEALLQEFTQKLQDNLLDTETLGLSVLDTLRGAALDWVKKEGPSLLQGMFTGDQKADTWERAAAQTSKHLGNALMVEIKRISEKSFEQALGNVNVPGVTLLNRSRAVKAFKEVKDTWRSGELSGIYEDAVSYAKKTFKEQVFDYEKMIATLSKTNWVDKISTALREGAQRAAVTLTNEAVSKLTSTLGVQLEAEQAKATGHVIDTQAISGAGARSVGIAGSVAITVLNADTSATVSDGGSLTVSGEMTVDANELRSVKNVASAALDSRGNAKDNKSSEAVNGRDIGGNEAKSVAQNDKKTTVLTVEAGGTATIREGDKGDDRPVFHIALEDGYKMPDGNKVNYTYTNKDGAEVHGTVVAKQDGEEWIIDTANDAELKKAGTEAAIELELKLVEVLTELPKPEVLADASVPEGTVSLAVRNREEKDGKLSARAGETVEVKVKRVEGMKLTGLGYAYTDESGVKHEVVVNPADDDGTQEKVFTMVSSSRDEYVYSLVMPKGQITEILAQMETGEEEAGGEEVTGASETSVTDASGTSVGVGASFSMVSGDAGTRAEIGRRSGTVTAGAMNVSAASDHMENISSAAGTDPLTGDLNADAVKTVGLDASVALNILDNDIKAAVDRASAVDVNAGDLNVTAAERSVTETTSSAFSVGDMTAVGASVAINIADTAVSASLEGGATVAGSAKVASDSHSEDTTKALATAMGADIARALTKAGQTVSGDLEKKANKLLAGDYMKASGKKDNETAKNINSHLDKKAADVSKTVEGQATSSNALRAFDAKTDNGGEATGDANAGVSEVNSATGAKLDGVSEQQSTKVMVAAAVGITAAGHEAGTSVGEIVAGKSIDLTSANAGNFNTLGTGAAMSLAQKSNAIAFGVAISVNSNAAGVSAAGDIISNDNEDVNVTSRLTQNLDGDFAGKLAAQSLAGSVAGKSGKVSLAGAVSVVTAGGRSTVDIAGGSEDKDRAIQGGNVTVEATDKSKLAARAGGLSLSTGASVGMGVGSTIVVSGNTVTAGIGDYAKIAAGSFKLNAEKQEVTLDDYKNLLNMRYLVTDSSNLTPEQREEANTGLIDLHKGEGENSYSVEVNLTSEKLLDAVDGLNFLSSQNTYAEAIAGSMGSGSTVSGSFAVAVSKNDVSATLGRNVTVDASKGDVTVNAGSGNNARIIAGSLSAAPGANATGVTVAVMVNSDKVNAISGDDIAINAAGNIAHTASATGDQQVFTGAMAVSAGGSTGDDGTAQKGTAIGGAVNTIVSKIEANDRLGKNAGLTAGKDVKLSAEAVLDLMAISGSAGIGVSMATAVGGTINAIVDRTQAETSLDTGARIAAGGGAAITSDVSDQLISGTASMSAAPGSTGRSVAGVVNVIVSKSTALTRLADGAVVKADGGDLDLTANNDAWLLNASMTGALGSDAGIGGAFNVNVLNRSARVEVGTNSALSASGDLRAQSSGRNTDIIAALAAAGATEGMAFSGNVGAVVENNDIATVFGNGVKATAGKNALIEAYYSDYTVDAAGNIAATAGSGGSVGATVLTMVKNNSVQTLLNDSAVSVSAAEGNAVRTLSGEYVHGVYVGANAGELQFIGAAGVAGSKGMSLEGEIVTLVNKNSVIADASKATLSSRGKQQYTTVFRLVKTPRGNSYSVVMPSDAETVEGLFASGTKLYQFVNGNYVAVNSLSEIENLHNGNIAVAARDDTRQLVLAGGVSASRGTGVGAAVTTLVSSKTVEAKAHDMAASNDIAVSAGNNDGITQVSVSAGVSGSNAVQIGAAIQVLKSKVNAEVGSAVKSTGGGFSLTADNTTDLNNAAVVLGMSGSTSVSPVGVVSTFAGETNAILKSGSTVEAGKTITIATNTEKTIDQYTIGVSAGRGSAISGAVNLQIAKDRALARAEQGTTLTSAEGGLIITAVGDYRLRAASAALAVSTETAPAVNAVVSVLKGSTTAELGGTADVKGAVNVQAQSRRDVIDIAATLGAGQIGAGVGVMVLVAGAPMSQDAADMIAYGNATSRDDDSRTFDAVGFMDSVNGSGKASEHYSDVLTGDSLAEDIRGNGHYESREQVGGKDEDGNNTFDATGKYRSADFDNERYDKTLDPKKDCNDSEKGRGEDLKTTVMYDKTGHVTTDASKAARMEDISDTSDVKNAKQVNTYTYEAPTDAVIARITETAVVTADQVTVIAAQPTGVDLIGATVAGGQAGMGVSTAVAILHSNVSASSTGVINNAAGGVNVYSYSAGSKHKDDKTASQRDNGVKSVLNNALDPSNRAIRVIGVAVGVGQISLAVSAAVALTDNVTQAVLGGRVNSAGNVTVKADHDYSAVLAATGTLAGGEVAAGASVAVAQANGTVKALIGKNTVGRSAGEDAYDIDAAGDVSVDTYSRVQTDALAASVGVGATAVNAGVALSLNRLEQETGIDEGVKLRAGKNLSVTASAKDAVANSYLLGASIGAAGVNLNAAVSDVAAYIDTHIGRNPDASANTEVTRVRAGGTITVQNDISSTAKPVALSLAGGVVAVGGNLLLAFNQTDAQAGVENSEIQAARLNVAGNLAGTVDSKLTAAQVGLGTLGISVNYADMRAVNHAVVVNSEVTTTDYTRIVTNENGEKTSAEAQTVSAEMGGLTVGLNAAIARNNTKSYATLIGDRQLDLGSLTMESNGGSTANANLDGVTLSLAKVAATAVVALNDADARTTVVVGNSEKSQDESGESHVGIVKDVLKAKNGMTFNASQHGATNAGITTGGGTLINAALSMAVAYGRTNSLVDVSISGGGEYAFIKSDNNASNAVDSTVKNSAFSAISQTALYGAAYSQDVYRTGIQLTGGDYTINGNVDVNMDYEVSGKADVQPSSSGVEVSLGALAANAAVANNTAYAGTDFETSIGSSRIVGDVNIKTQGMATTDARVQTANLTVKGASFTANIAKSGLSMTQAAVLRVGGNLDVDGGVDVQSVVKQKDDGAAKATATVGALAGKDSLNIVLDDLSVSKATARENMSNSAAILGAASDTDEADVPVDYGDWVQKEVTDVDYDTVESVTYKFDKGSFHFETTANEGDFVARTRVLNELLHYTYQLQDWNKSKMRDKIMELFVGKDSMQNSKQWAIDVDYADRVYKVMEVFVDNAKTYSYNWVKNPLTGKYERYFVEDAKCPFPQKALEKAFAKADELGVWDFYADSDNWKEEYNYATVTKVTDVWEEDIRYEKGLVPVYDTDSNFLNVGGKMNVFSGAQNGSKTLAEAKVDMGSTYGLATAGSLEVNARSTDSFSALLEGMHATVGGDAAIKAASDTNATATGAKSGGLSGFSGGKIDVKAGVGKSSDLQTVNVVIGEGASLMAKSIDLYTKNLGKATAGMKQDTNKSVVGIESSTQPTESWYSTGVYVGTGAKLNATNGGLTITSEDRPSAESIAKSSSIGFAVNFNTLKGKNYIKQTNRIDIGKDVELKSTGELTLQTVQVTTAHAETEASGGGLLQGNTVKAENTIKKASVITVADGVNIASTNGNVILHIMGTEGGGRYDDIYTRAYSDGAGGWAVANAQAYADVTSDSNILVGQGVNLTAKDSLRFISIFNPHGDVASYAEQNDGYLPGIQTIAIADSAALIGIPKTTAKTTVNATNYIDINRSGNKHTTLKGSRIWINAATDRTTIKSQARSYGAGAVGVASSTAWIIANLNNMVWIDNATLESDQSSEIDVYANNGGSGAGPTGTNRRTHLIADSYSGLDALTGKVAPSSLVTGLTINQIRSNDTSKVKWEGLWSRIAHEATNPRMNLWDNLTANYKRWQLKVLGITITLTKANVTKKYEWIDMAQCDFCGDSGKPVDVKSYDDDTDIDQRYNDAYDRAMAPIDEIYGMAASLGLDLSALAALRLAKGLTPLTDIMRTVSRGNNMTRARYGEEDYAEAANRFALDCPAILKKDVTLDSEQISGYRLWTNTGTSQDVYLLPNATRLYGVQSGGNIVPQYVVEALRGDIGGESFDIDVITALTDRAAASPVMPVGSTGTLDFLTGTLTLPSLADFDLYLHEVSARWLLDRINEGFICGMIADPDEANAAAMSGTELPEGGIAEGLIPDGEADGWKSYWLGDTPETAADPDQTLVYLLVNETTDEVDAFRTSVNMLKNGIAPVDVSLYLYRDAQADREEKEKYNCLFFDTPEGEKSLVKVLTNVVGDQDIVVPRPMRIVLRGFRLDAADLPFYGLSGHFFVMRDGTKGGVSLFNGFYTNTFDGAAFESDYIRIEGIAEGDLSVTIKQGQVIWPEWTGEDAAEDIAGNRYVRVEGEWHPEGDAPAGSLPEDTVAA